MNRLIAHASGKPEIYNPLLKLEVDQVFDDLYTSAGRRRSFSSF